MLKFGKVLGYGASTLGLVGIAGGALITGIALPGMAALIPAVAIPASVLAMFPAQKLMNETIYKGYKDLMLVTQKGKTVKIVEDETRLDIIKELRGLDNTQKAGFLSLQTIALITKMGTLDKKGEPLTFETDTHGVARRTLQALNTLGYIKNYEEKQTKKSHLLIEKLAFGNMANLKRKSQIYNIKFQRTDKPIELDELRESGAFTEIFGTEEQEGLLDKRQYKVISNQDGTLSIEYPKRKREDEISSERLPEEEQKTEVNEREKFKAELSKDAPSLEEQKRYSELVQENHKAEQTPYREPDSLDK